MESIEIKVRINQTVYTEVDVYEIIDSINELPITKRWNYCAQIINSINTNEDQLTPEQKEVTIKWLKTKLENFNNLIT